MAGMTDRLMAGNWAEMLEVSWAVTKALKVVETWVGCWAGKMVVKKAGDLVVPLVAYWAGYLVVQMAASWALTKALKVVAM